LKKLLAWPPLGFLCCFAPCCVLRCCMGACLHGCMHVHRQDKVLRIDSSSVIYGEVEGCVFSTPVQTLIKN
jgi:hypothetical protein